MERLVEMNILIMKALMVMDTLMEVAYGMEGLKAC